MPETYEIPGFGYSIDYPEGWTARTQGCYTAFTELEIDNPRAFSGSSSYEGFAVGFEHRTRDFLENLGLEEEATLAQLLAFNSSFFDWDTRDLEEITLFSEPAIRIAVNGESGAAIMDFSGDDVLVNG